MRLFKLAVISAVAFFSLLCAFTFLLPSKIRISRAIDIASNREKVLPLVQQLNLWKGWNVYLQNDSTKFNVRLLSITDTLVTSSWRVDEKTFLSGLAIYENRAGTTTVQWYFDIQLRWYPWEKIASIVYDQQMGSNMQESLVKLKADIESNP
jgi:hypothetical protein